MLRLVVSLLLAPPLAAAASAASLAPARGSTACPYDLSTATRMIPRECYANATAGQAATGCCWYVFAAYIFAAADHANRTGDAFLPAEPAAACSDAFAARLLSSGLVSPSLLANNGSCDLTGDPGKLAAGSRPCQLATIADVRAMAPRALPNATRLCAAPGVARVPCGMAATVAVWSRAPPPLERFRAYALCMLQVLENVNSLGTSDLVPSPPPPPAAEATIQSPRLPSSSSRKNTVAIAVGSASAVVVAVVAVASAAMAIVTIRRRRRSTTAGDVSDDESVASLPPLPREGLYIFTKSELKQATNGYDEKLLLGTGGAGKVYLGRLPSGQRVAIKKIYRSKKVSEFYAEVAVLAKLRHRNLTTLVGYCLGARRGDHHALVYEYLAGGNLWRALFQGELPWQRRLQVAVDVAEGLAYLHGFREGAVVHRDVKPTNVLLSESGAAKLSDFGVSRIVPEGGTHVSTEVRGTRGYVDPESFSAGHVSEAGDVYSFGVVLLELATGMRAVIVHRDIKSSNILLDEVHPPGELLGGARLGGGDVYSFGVVLLELATGMRAVVPTPSGGAESIVHAAHWAVGQAGGEAGAAAESMVDKRLGANWDRPTVRAVFALACRCVRPYKHERPAMGEVLAELKAMLADYTARGGGAGADADRSEASTSSSTATPDPASLPSTSSSVANTEAMATPPRRDS
uniref:Protein kinase domain-containing protein n=1 Tax=Oryza punctata TaxID=4537 RepID=A0A0E0LIM1_ORYPU